MQKVWLASWRLEALIPGLAPAEAVPGRALFAYQALPMPMMLSGICNSSVCQTSELFAMSSRTRLFFATLCAPSTAHRTQ